MIVKTWDYNNRLWISISLATGVNIKFYKKAMASTEVTHDFKHPLTFGNVKAFGGSQRPIAKGYPS